MTIIEAIGTLDEIGGYLDNCPKEDEIFEALSIAEDALEKQIPKRPIMGHCANCGIDLDIWNFCPVCGQKLGGSDEE